MKKLINKMATPMLSRITMTTRMGAEPCRVLQGGPSGPATYSGSSTLANPSELRF